MGHLTTRTCVGEDGPIPNVHGYRKDVVEGLKKIPADTCCPFDRTGFQI
jgi:hypothetical protein